MNREETRRALIDGTIRVLARDGMEKATTKAIATEAGLNEVYIYRLFGDQEGLLIGTFESLDQELIDTLQAQIPLLEQADLPVEQRCYRLFSYIWSFLLGNSEKCLSFIRYYYSPYFMKFSCEKHKAALLPTVNACAPAFKNKANTGLLLNHVFDTMLVSAIKVFQGELPNDPQTTDYMFNLVYASVESQLTWSKRQNITENEVFIHG